MAQLTERLVREFMSYADRGAHPPMTANEARQLCYSWLQANGKSTHADRPTLETISAQHDETGRMWEGPRDQLPPGYSAVKRNDGITVTDLRGVDPKPPY